MYLTSCLRQSLVLEDREVEWLGLNTFIQSLEVITNGSPSSQLTYAIDSSHTFLLWKIKVHDRYLKV
ncbi:hypothetical protein NC652_002202 [Populus alba x Populus x berolinensis]|nr:hypothetical protein NC652_002202 [Populus alba x Populus x berolinensis]